MTKVQDLELELNALEELTGLKMKLKNWNTPSMNTIYIKNTKGAIVKPVYPSVMTDKEAAAAIHFAYGIVTAMKRQQKELEA